MISVIPDTSSQAGMLLSPEGRLHRDTPRAHSWDTKCKKRFSFHCWIQDAADQDPKPYHCTKLITYCSKTSFWYESSVSTLQTKLVTNRVNYNFYSKIVNAHNEKMNFDQCCYIHFWTKYLCHSKVMKDIIIHFIAVTMNIPNSYSCILPSSCYT